MSNVDLKKNMETFQTAFGHSKTNVCQWNKRGGLNKDLQLISVMIFRAVFAIQSHFVILWEDYGVFA